MPLFNSFPPVLDSTKCDIILEDDQPEASEDEEESYSAAQDDDEVGELSGSQSTGNQRDNQESGSQVEGGQHEDRYIVADENISAFLRCLGADVAPLHQLMRASIVPLIEHYLHTHSLQPAEYETISESCPILFKFIESVKRRNNGVWAESLTPLLRRIIQSFQSIN